MTAAIGAEGVSLVWTAPKGLYSSTTLRVLGEAFVRFAAAAAVNPDIKVCELPLLTAADRETVVERWNATRRPYPAKGIAAIFREQALRSPEAVALSMGDQRLSYAALDRRANGVARILLLNGIGAGTTCSICMERSFDLAVTIIGILKAGAAHVALDPAYPRERISLMHATAQARAVVTRAEHRGQLERCGGKILLWDELSAEVGDGQSDAPSVETGPEDLAYVCFTSGSTGRPKAVAVTQRGCVRLACNADYADLGPGQAFLLHSPLSFDASTFELWAPLLNGGRLEILPSGSLDLRLLGRTISDGGITTLWLTAALFAALVDERLADLRGVGQVIAGGDVVSVEHARRFLAAYPTCRLINGYGPTENTTFSTCHTVREEDLSRLSLPIGRPIANATAYVLDAEGQPLPPLFPGELHVGGDGIARGYIGDSELTAARFVAGAFDPRTGLLYRTGDRARWLTDGSIEFLGRLDHQVKIDGYRIELGEIEAALLGIAGVQQAAVVAFEVGARKQLAAFIVGAVDPHSVQKALRETLPEYLVPPRIEALASLPLSLHGKVDRSLMLDILQKRARIQGGPPRTNNEMHLLLLWQKCLNSHDFGIHDNFFALGGKSLTAAKLFAMISREFGCDLPLATLVEAPTVAQLGARLTRAESAGDIRVTVFCDPPMASVGTWFLIPGAGSDPIVFIELAKTLGKTHAIVGLQARALDGNRHKGGCSSIPAVAKAMVAEIVARQAAGPYFIGGHCFGAVLAWEIAFQLEALGQTVGSLALLDPTISDVFSDNVFGGGRWPYHWQRLRATPWLGKAAYVGRRCSNFVRTMFAQKSIRPAQRRARQIHSTYAFPRRQGRVWVFLAGDSFYGLAPASDPRRFYESRANGDGFSYHEIAGDHHSMLHGCGAEAVAGILGASGLVAISSRAA